MSIQIHNHGFLYVVMVLEQEANGERDVRVRTEAPAALGGAVMEAAAYVDTPASLQG